MHPCVSMHTGVYTTHMHTHLSFERELFLSLPPPFLLPSFFLYTDMSVSTMYQAPVPGTVIQNKATGACPDDALPSLWEKSIWTIRGSYNYKWERKELQILEGTSQDHRKDGQGRLYEEVIIKQRTQEQSTDSSPVLPPTPTTFQTILCLSQPWMCPMDGIISAPLSSDYLFSSAKMRPWLDWGAGG